VVTYVARPDDTGSTQYVSPQIESVLGFTQAEWLADPERWAKQVHPEDRERSSPHTGERATTSSASTGSSAGTAASGRCVTRPASCETPGASRWSSRGCSQT
jgi:hypothetical protein